MVQRQSQSAGDLWRVLPVALAVLCLLTAGMAVAQPSASTADEPAVLEGPPPGALTGWGSLAVRYLLVTAVCVAAFTLVFLKCWRDVSESPPPVDDDAEEPPLDADAEAPAPPSALAPEKQAAG